MAPVDDRSDLLSGADGLSRCWWAGEDRLMRSYHDLEWARGPRDERSLFERLALEAFQAGLSWRIVLERREDLRAAFADFDPLAVAALSAHDIADVLAQPRVIRNDAKVRAIVSNARVLLQLHAEGGGLRTLTEEVLATAEPLQGAVPTVRADVPAHTPASLALARRLKRAGWRFVGPTTAYAYLQAVGWVDDHLAGCHARVPPQVATPLR
jgi:DNA-3-methyladenine glycosylase I